MLTIKKVLNNAWQISHKILVNFVYWLVSIYRYWFAILLPHNRCIYEPTCSNYYQQAILKYGLLKGSWLGAKRILSCHPHSNGGYDPLP